MLNRYEMIKPLGKGSFGEVMLAKDKALGRLVAIKKTPSDSSTISEMEILKRASHKGLPQVYDMISDGNITYMVMEYIEGISLRNFIDNSRPIDESLAIRIILEIIDIIAYLHGLTPPVIYRDLKPENVMVKSDMSIMLIDLGGAFFRDYSGVDGKDIYGTYGYSAPELWQGKRGSVRSDIYSIGAILHDMLSGVSANEDTRIKRPLREYNNGISIGLEKIVLRCLSDNEDERYKNTDELLKDLNEYGKLEEREVFMFNLRKIIVFMGYLLSSGYLIGMIYKKGIRAIESFDLISISIAFLAAILIHYVLIYKNVGRNNVVVKKEIFLTAKKGYGLFVLMAFFLGLGFGSALFRGVSNKAYAKSLPLNMWVNMKDSNERSVLIKGNGAYEIDEVVRLEIPKESMPGDEVTIRVVALGKDGSLYESRDFKVKNTNK